MCHIFSSDCRQVQLNIVFKMDLFKSLTFLFVIVSTSSAFELVKVEPASTTVPYGGKLRLTCNPDGYYEWCKFIHNDKICDFEWKKDVWNITKLDCSDYEGRAHFFGSYDNYECGMELDNVTPEGKKNGCFNKVCHILYSLICN